MNGRQQLVSDHQLVSGGTGRFARMTSEKCCSSARMLKLNSDLIIIVNSKVFSQRRRQTPVCHRASS